MMSAKDLLHIFRTALRTDDDTIWAECDDYGYHYDLDDIVVACKWYERAQEVVREEKGETSEA